jgi:hypothetical protein
VHWRHEAIALARDGLDESGILRVILQYRAKFLQPGIQASIEIDMGTLGPEDLAELISCDNLPLLPEEHLQDAKGLLLNPERNPVTGEGSASQINLEETKSHFDGGIGFGHRLATPNDVTL